MTAPHQLRDWTTLRVASVTPVADGVVVLGLQRDDGGELTPWEAGSHLEINLPECAVVRHYSLCGRRSDTGEYRIAILRDPDSRGGSAFIHEKVAPGDTIQVRGPRNNFVLESGSAAYTFIAGGIGITPIKPMVEELAAAGIPWKLHYGGRTRSSMAFVDELRALPHGQVQIIEQDTQGLLDIDGILADLEPETAVYCCGPEGLIAAVRDGCERHGIGPLHFERFAAPEADSALAAAGLDHFIVEMAASGAEVEVGHGQSILEAARAVDPGLPSSCEEGHCGTCETPVIDGIPVHRDSFLTPSEQASNETMMICVGGSYTPRLVLDI
jgi:ferredoxin-NADP reductase